MQSFTELYNLLVTSRHYPAVDACSLFQQQQERCAVSSVSCYHQRCVTWRSGRRVAAGSQPRSHPPPSFYPTSFLLSSSLLHLLHLLSHSCPSSLLPHPRPPPSPLSLPRESTDSSSSFSCGKSFSKMSTSFTPSLCPQWHNTAWWRSEGGGGTSSEKSRDVSKLLSERISTPVKPLFRGLTPELIRNSRH